MKTYAVVISWVMVVLCCLFFVFGKFPDSLILSFGLILNAFNLIVHYKEKK